MEQKAHHFQKETGLLDGLKDGLVKRTLDDAPSNQIITTIEND